MTVKDLRGLLGLSQVALSKKYDIPVRTIQDWEAGKRKAPVYVLKLLERAIREDYKKAFDMAIDKQFEDNTEQGIIDNRFL